MNMPLVLLNRRRRGGAAAFTPAGLFALAEPGVWYDPSDVANLAWRRNLLTFTEQFDNAAWTKLNATITANSTAAPDGTTTADTLFETTATGNHQATQALTVAASAPHSVSIYVKANGRTKGSIECYGASSPFNGFKLVFDLTAKTVTSSVVASGTCTASSIEELPNGWFKISGTGTFSTTTSIVFGPRVANDAGSESYAGDITKGLFVWGAQLELGSVATDYQKITDVNTEVIERFPSATLYQDTAGTTPVTTPGQTVALALDKSKGLVLGSELVDTANTVAGWTPYGSNTVTSDDSAIKITFVGGTDASFGAFSNLNAAGCLSQDLVANKTYEISFVARVSSGGSVDFGIRNGSTSPAVAAVTIASSSYATYKVRFLTNTPFSSTPNFSLNGTFGTGEAIWLRDISVKELPGFHATQATLASRPTYGIVPLGGRRNLLLNTDTLATQSRTVTAVAHTLSFTGTGTVTLTGASTAGPLVGTGVSNRVSLTFTPTAASLTLTVSGSVTLAQLELGSTVTNYQRVGSAFDVTEAGVASLSYLSFDGIDDHLVTPTVSFSTDKMTVFAGVRKLSDAAQAILVELTASAAANNGAFNVQAPIGASGEYRFVSKGTVSAFATSSALSAPRTNILTGLADIGADSTILRVNGAQVEAVTTDQGTGNYSAQPLYIGRRGGATLPFNGQLFSLIVRNAVTDSTTVSNTETWVNQRTGAYT